VLEPGVGGRGDPTSPRPIRTGGGEEFTASEITLFDVFALLLRQRYLILSVVVAWFLFAVVMVLVKPRTYTSSVAFVSQQSDGGMGGLSGVAAQLGLRVPTGQTSRSPDFYSELLKADETYRRVAEKPVEIMRDGRKLRVPLTAALGIDKGSAAQRLDASVRALRKLTSVSTKRESGLVRFSVRTTSPELSYQTSSLLLQLVNQFNLETSQTQASAERQFAGARLDEAAADLRSAEDALQQFLTRNRQFSTAPDLMFEHERLQRRVAMRQQLVTALAEAVARARIEEVRDAPPLTVIEPPRLAVLPDPRGLVTKGLVGILAGLLLGITLGVLREIASRRWRAGEQGVREFVKERDDTLRDLGLRRRAGRDRTD
jgi:uncharacterized protein involved in exopolysaccharide biosynthesis